MKKKFLFLFLFPLCTYSVDWLTLCGTLKKFSLDFLASEMFTESGDHWGKLSETTSQLSEEEKRKLMVTAATQRQEEENNIRKKLEAYLREETKRQQKDPEYLRLVATAQLTGEAIPKINDFEMQNLKKKSHICS